MREGRELNDSGKRAWGRKSYTLEWVAPDKHVLIVNVDSDGVNYGFYIGAVEGKDYGEEALDVVKNGSGVYPPIHSAYFNHRFGRHSKRPWPQNFQYYLEHPTVPSPPYNLPKAWAPDIVDVLPLDKHVLVVATMPAPSIWGAYIGAVKGEDYEKEARDVVKNGSEMPFDAAESLFGDFGKLTLRGEMKWHREPQPKPDRT